MNSVRNSFAIGKDWIVGSFVSATMDYLFNTVDLGHPLLNSVKALIQLSISVALCHEIFFTMADNKMSAIGNKTWILSVVIWEMSPGATANLKNGYYSFHRLLYGSDNKQSKQSKQKTNTSASAKKEPCCKSCAE